MDVDLTTDRPMPMLVSTPLLLPIKVALNKFFGFHIASAAFDKFTTLHALNVDLQAGQYDSGDYCDELVIDDHENENEAGPEADMAHDRGPAVGGEGEGGGAGDGDDGGGGAVRLPVMVAMADDEALGEHALERQPNRASARAALRELRSGHRNDLALSRTICHDRNVQIDVRMLHDVCESTFKHHLYVIEQLTKQETALQYHARAASGENRQHVADIVTILQDPEKLRRYGVGNENAPEFLPDDKTIAQRLVKLLVEMLAQRAWTQMRREIPPHMLAVVRHPDRPTARAGLALIRESWESFAEAMTLRDRAGTPIKIKRLINHALTDVRVHEDQFCNEFVLIGAHGGWREDDPELQFLAFAAFATTSGTREFLENPFGFLRHQVRKRNKTNRTPIGTNSSTFTLRRKLRATKGCGKWMTVTGKRRSLSTFANWGKGCFLGHPFRNLKTVGIGLGRK